MYVAVGADDRRVSVAAGRQRLGERTAPADMVSDDVTIPAFEH